MRELRGKPVADALTQQLKTRIEKLAENGITPTLAIVRVGERADDLSYERGAQKRFAGAGADVQVHTLRADCSQADLENTLTRLSRDPAVDGILLFRPLPAQLSEARAKSFIDPAKDVDCFTDEGYAALLTGSGKACPPCTPAAVMELLDHYGIDLTGKRVTIVGRSLVVGKPLMLMMLAKNATVTVCHTRTADLPAECRRADILVACVGKAKMIDASYVREGQIVVDVGINVDEAGNLCGDVDYESVSAIAEAITPVPRGVGSITTAVLLKHVTECAERSAETN